MLVCVVLSCLFGVATCGHLLERTDLLAVLFVVFCHSPNGVLVHIRIKGEVGAVKLV